MMLNSGEGEDALGGGWSADGGEYGDGTYILMGEDLETYPSGQPGFRAVE